MADVIQFVDAPSASPTVRLDINDDDKWFAREFLPNLPRLRRSQSQNMLRDGGHVAASVYDMRTLVVSLDLNCATQDIAAAEVQKLARELDRETNYIRYQPTDATFPVFFKTYRSDVSNLVRFAASRAYQNIGLEIVADPFAQGLRESLSIGAVAGTAPYFDVAAASIKGDVAAPFVLVDGTPATGTTTGVGARYNWQLAASTRDAASQPTVVQCESLTLGTDMAVSGGNARQTATSTSMATRMTYAPTGATARALRGTYRLYAIATGTATTAGATLTAQAYYGANAIADISTGTTFSDTFAPGSAERWAIDLGTVNFDTADSLDPAPRIEVQSSLSVTVGPPVVDWDFLILVPADESRAVVEASWFSGFPTSSPLVLDGETDRVYAASSTALWAGATMVYEKGFAFTGALPKISPGVDNRFVYFRYSRQPGSPPSTGYSNAASGSLSLLYTPLYLHLRPVSG